ncbi:DUF2934 domain-containing protein [Devosia rhodophyticola]|uniref:DUF2934 domain-containing protein n=1 Tax=Devosia rhodophyticola TaxID=3026423 RepID=A0ABY7YYL2_9HYPH|nr:DUF2934 domain-containing protein [Devosia rhodophyticola]WDR06322.1 DUF2934 domain-containing protein [Devosia rhodophyticola]
MLPPEPPADPEEDEAALDAWHQAIANTAYFLWQQDGSPEGRADQYWQRAEEKHLRQRAYDVRLRQGTSDGGEKDFERRSGK